MSMKAASKLASPMISTICGSAIPPTCVPSASPPWLSIRFTRFSCMLPSRESGSILGAGELTQQRNRSPPNRFHTGFRLRGLGVQGETSYQPLGRSDEEQMSSLIKEETVAFVRGVAAEARRVVTPCGEGRMFWHVWGDGPPLALLHGGYGSWSHWTRNVN